MYRFLLLVWLGLQALAAAPQTDNDALAQQAVESERRGDFSGAIAAFQALLRNGVDSPPLRNNLGIAYFETHQFREALTQFQAALKTNSDSVPANLFAGLSLLNLQHPQQALAYLQKAHRLQPSDITAVLALARAEIACDHLASSRDYYQQAVQLDRNSAEAWYGLGIMDRVLAEQALKHATPAAKADAMKNPRALMDASTDAIAHAMQLDPGSVQAHMVMGEAFRIAERYDLAVHEYKAATEQQPNLAPAWAGLAAAESASGDDRSAFQAASRAVELEPKDAETEALIAGILLRMGDYANAEPHARRALTLRPNLASAQMVLAKIYLARHQPQRALPELQSAVKQDRDGAAYYLLAATLRQLNRPADAAAAMQKYKQLHSAYVAVTSGAH